MLNNDRIGEVPIDIIRTLSKRFWFTICPERSMCVNRRIFIPEYHNASCKYVVLYTLTAWIWMSNAFIGAVS